MIVSSMAWSLVFSVFSLVAATISAYTPIVFMHGLLGSHNDFSQLISFIETSHPGTECVALQVDERVHSLVKSMDAQVMDVIANIREVTVNFTEYHVIAHSQGTLLARAAIEEMDDHKVKKFISIAGPQQGQYGLPDEMKEFLPDVAKEVVHDLWYNALGQDVISVAGYWNDPRHHEAYLEHVRFLPRYNNQVNSSDSQRYKENFLRISELIALGSDGDEVISPWDSSLFNFFTYEKDYQPLDMMQTEVYVEDLFGLQTLDKRGSLTRRMVPGLKHVDWFSHKEALLTVLSYLD